MTLKCQHPRYDVKLPQLNAANDGPKPVYKMQMGLRHQKNIFIYINLKGGLSFIMEDLLHKSFKELGIVRVFGYNIPGSHKRFCNIFFANGSVRTIAWNNGKVEEWK